MKAIYFAEEHEAFRANVRAFLETSLLPHLPEWEHARAIPKSAWRLMGEEGYLGLAHREIYGGRDSDIFTSVVWLEEVARLGYGGLRSAVAMQSYMATRYLHSYASRDLNERYLTKAISGDMVAGLAATEPSAGSDLRALRSQVVPVGEAYRLSGQKAFIANGTFADFFIVPARLAGGSDGRQGADDISLFLVESTWPGVTVKAQNLASWKCAGMATIEFRNVEVPAENLIGAPGKGFSYLMHTFQFERLIAGIIALGGAEHSLQHLTGFLTERKAFGKPLGDQQVIRHRLAEMAMRVEAVRQLVYHAAWVFQSDDWAIKECSMAKLAAGDLSLRLAQEAVQLHGAAGCMDDSETIRNLNDASGMTIAAGTSEIMREIIAAELLG